MRRDTTFQDASYEYGRLRSQFTEFCSLCAEGYTDNEHFPGVSFRVQDEHATLCAFDQVFKFTIAPIGQHIGVMTVSMIDSLRKDELITIARWYFSSDGNVKDTMDARWGWYPIVSREFVKTVGNTIATNYMAYISKSLGIDDIS